MHTWTCMLAVKLSTFLCGDKLTSSVLYPPKALEGVMLCLTLIKYSDQNLVPLWFTNCILLNCNYFANAINYPAQEHCYIYVQSQMISEPLVVGRLSLVYLQGSEIGRFLRDWPWMATGRSIWILLVLNSHKVANNFFSQGGFESFACAWFMFVSESAKNRRMIHPDIKGNVRRQPGNETKTAGNQCENTWRKHRNVDEEGTRQLADQRSPSGKRG